MSEWQSIETAPRNGTAILLWLSQPIRSIDADGYAPWTEISAVIGWWDGGWEICFMREGSADSFGQSSNFYMNPKPGTVTHWMPLPGPPLTSAIRQEGS